MLEVIRMYEVETAAGRFSFGSDLDAKYADMKLQLRSELSMHRFLILIYTLFKSVFLFFSSRQAFAENKWTIFYLFVSIDK